MKKIHVFSGWLLLICMAAVAGICTARYETEIQKTTTVKAQTESRIAFLTTDDLRKEADTYTIPYVVKNTSDRQAVYEICVRASLGIEDAENLEITLEQEEATYAGRAEVIKEGSVLAHQFGDGWVYRFYKENKECTWQLDRKDEEKTGTLTFSWKKDADGNAYMPKYVSHLNVAACELDSNGHPYFLEQSEDLVLDPADDVTAYQGEFLTTERQSVQLADWIIPEVTVDSGETGSDAGTGESIDKSNSTDTDTEENDTSAEPESLDEDEGAEVSVQPTDKVDTSEIEVQAEDEAEVPTKTVTFALPEGSTETPTVVVDDTSQEYVEASVSESDGEGRITLTATPAAQQLSDVQQIKMSVTCGSYSADVRVRLIPYGQENSLDLEYAVTDRKSSLLAVYMAKREDVFRKVKVEKADGDTWTGVRYSLDQGQTWIVAYEGEISFKDQDDWNGLLLLDLSTGDGESKAAVTVKTDQEAKVSELPDSGIQQTHFLLRGYGKKQDKEFTLDSAWNKLTFSYKIQMLEQIPKEELLAAEETEVLKWEDLSEEEPTVFSVTEKNTARNDKNWVIAISDSGTRPEAGIYRLVLRWRKDNTIVYERVLDFFVEYERLT